MSTEGDRRFRRAASAEYRAEADTKRGLFSRLTSILGAVVLLIVYRLI